MVEPEVTFWRKYIYLISPDSQVYLLPFRPCETTIQTFNIFLIWDLESQLNKNSHHPNACVFPSQLCCPTTGDKSSNSNLPAQVTDNVWCDWSQGNIRNNAKQLPSIDQIIFQVPPRPFLVKVQKVKFFQPQMEMAFRCRCQDQVISIRFKKTKHVLILREWVWAKMMYFCFLKSICHQHYSQFPAFFWFNPHCGCLLGLCHPQLNDLSIVNVECMTAQSQRGCIRGEGSRANHPPWAWPWCA